MKAARTVEVRGSVIETVRVRDNDSKGWLFTPLVRFQTLDGKAIEFQSGHRRADDRVFLTGMAPPTPPFAPGLPSALAPGATCPYVPARVVLEITSGA